MTVEDNNFNIKNGLSVGTGRHQVLDSDGRITANYFTLNSGGRYLSAGVDLYDLISTQGVPPVSTNAWNNTHDQVASSAPGWDGMYSWINTESATIDTEYNRNTYVNVSGDIVTGSLGISGELNVVSNTDLEGSLSVDGHTYLSAAMYVENDAHVMGNLRVDGDVWLAVEGVYPKVVYVGATSDDNIVFVAGVSSNFIPNHDTTFDLGTIAQQWRELFVHDISASSDIFVGNDLHVSANGTIGTNFHVSGHTTVGGDTVLSGTLDVDNATNINDTLDVKRTATLHDDMYVSGHTTVGGDTVLSGTLDVEEFATFYNDVSVCGDLYVDGNAYLSAGVDGNIYVGDTNTDNVVFHADIDSGLTPNRNVTFDLGTGTQQWRELFVQDISASNDIFVDNDLLVSANGTIGEDFIVSGHTTVGGDTVLSGTLDVDDATYVYDTLNVDLDTQLHSNLFVTSNTTVSGNTTLSGTLDVREFTTLHDDLSVCGDLYVDGNAYLSAGVDGNIYVGDTNTDNVVFRADIDSNIIPDNNIMFDLGTSTQQWRELYVQDVSATNDIFVDNNLSVSGDGTFTGRVSAVSGLNVVGDTTLTGELSVTSNTHLLSDVMIDQDVYIKGSIVVDGHAYFGFGGQAGQINLGDDQVDEIIFHADVGSDILPYPTNTYDLGSLSRRWRTIYTRDINASGNIVAVDLTISGEHTQRKIISNTEQIYKVDNIWRKENLQNTSNDKLQQTFTTDYQSVKFYILTTNATGTSTINAEYVCDGVNIGGTVYGNATTGIDPINNVDCVISNGYYLLKINVKQYTKIMITGTAMKVI
jgi:predicted acyltransferase (DUF342 family)